MLQNCRFIHRSNGGIGIRKGLKIPGLTACGFDSHFDHQAKRPLTRAFCFAPATLKAEHMSSSSFFSRGLFGVVIVFGCVLPDMIHAYTSPGVSEGFVNDYANVLSLEEEADLESVLHTYEQNSTNEVAVVTVSSTAEETIESYAVQLFEDWGIGKRGQDTGVLMLIAVQDRRVRIEVGYGLESLLTDAESQRIIQRATPLFQEGRYYEAMSQMVLEVESVLSDYENTSGTASSKETSAFVAWTDRFIERLPPGVGALLLIVATFLLLAVGRFFLGFVLACLAYVVAYLFSLITNRPRPVFKRFFAGALSGFFSGILSGVFRSGGSGGGGSSSGGFGGGRSGGGGSSGSW